MGLNPFIGKKVAVNPSYFALTGAVMIWGYDNPLEAVDWGNLIRLQMTSCAAVIRGDVEYALMGTDEPGCSEMAKTGKLTS